MIGRSLRITGATGVSILFDTTRDSEYVFETIAGTGAPATTIFQSAVPSMHGAWREEALLEPRELTVRGYVTSKRGLTDDESRQAMDANLRALYRAVGQVDSDLTITYKTTTGAYVAYGTISAQAEHGARVRINGRHFTPVTLTMTCCRPLWYAEQWDVQQLRYNARGLRFPLQLPTSMGIGGYRKTIYNDSAAAIPVQFDLIGPAAQPTIINVTRGTQMALTRPLGAGERLVIDTDPDCTSVTYTDSSGAEINAIGYVDAEADNFEFLRLWPGENVILFESGDDLWNATVVMRWRQTFAGV